MRRAAISITSNIAEWFSRIFYEEKIRFYSIALGSLTELQSQFLVVGDIKYIKEKYEVFHNQSIIVHKLINGFTYLILNI